MYKVYLVIDGKEFPLNRVNFYVIRKRDKNGRPVSMLAWTINVNMNSTTDGTFTEWMIDPNKKKNVSVKFIQGTDTKKEWQFDKAYCIGFEENFVADAGVMETQIIISGETVNNGNATITANWQS